MRRAIRGSARHFALCLELSLRSRQALVYGYAVPVLFLVAFGAVFRAEQPQLYGEMGQVIVITILGGACFGMPTSLVAERERGIWRRYRLLPAPMWGLVAGVLAARVVIVGSGALMQVGLARLLFGTPFPAHPLVEAAAVVLVTATFLGFGLIVAATANDVPAVQAIGQCLFLPLILIGGVGVPLLALPDWVRAAAAYMPGRYAVEAIQLAYSDPRGLAGAGFALLALGVTGACAAVAGAMLFRWEPGRRAGRRRLPWYALAALGCVATGLAATWTDRLSVAPPPARGYQELTDEQLRSIPMDGLTGDAEFVSRLSRPFTDGGVSEGVGAIASSLRSWPPRRASGPVQNAANLLSVAAIADVSEDLHEGEIARLVYYLLRSDYGAPELEKILGWIILHPEDGTVVTHAPELGLRRRIPEALVRQRIGLYARKFLGRLQGRLPD